MDKTKAMQILVIIVVIALAGSIIATGLIYNEGSGTTNTINPEDILNTAPSAFDYEISFDANVIKELKSIRIAADTSSIDKPAIDRAIKDLDGVSRITSSSFRKTGEDKWFYFAEIDLKKSSVVSEVVQSIFAQDFFGAERQAMKRVTINTPQTVAVKNVDLNITRDFTFDYPTTVTLANLTTIPGDIINVSGRIKLQGKAVLELELAENSNATAQPEFFTIDKELELTTLAEDLFFEAMFDGNVDQNTFEAQVKAIDANAEAMAYNFGGTTSLALRSTTAYLSELQTDLAEYGGDFYQIGEFDLASIFIEDLNQEVILTPSSFQAKLNTNHSQGETISLELTVSVSRDTASVAQAEEN